MNLNPLRSEWLKIRDSVSAIAAIGFALRIVYVILAHTYQIKSVDDNFSFGFEMGRIGRALAAGQGFSNPFHGVTGPTAWEPPLYPFLISLVFKFCGIYSRYSAIVLFGLNSFFAAATCVPIFFIAKRCFDDSVARWTAWLWALLPTVMFWSVRWIWETSLAAFLLALIFWLSIVMEERSGTLTWIGFGALWGIAALTNTSLLAFLPASGIWICFRCLRLEKRFFRGILLSASVFLICIFPWLIRNDQTFGQFVFIRSNFGAELRLGNGPGARGLWMDYLHPSKNADELRRYRDMGEIAYVAERRRQAIAFIREDFPRFAELCARRFFFYWSGVARPGENLYLSPIKYSIYFASSILSFVGLWTALRNLRPASWLFFWLLVCYPLVFYITFPHPRYRHPIEPQLGMLIVYSISYLRKIKRRKLA